MKSSQKAHQSRQDRMTVPKSKKSKKEPSRKARKGRKPRRKRFEDIRLGYLMRYRAPIEFALIVDSCGTKDAPSADIIEKLAYISENKFFRTIQFRRALIDYRKNGLRSKKAWSVTHKPKR